MWANFIKVVTPAIAGFCLLGESWLLRGQQLQQREPGVFRTEAALLELEVRAAGSNGKPVLNLNKKDFAVFENGELQEIATFDFIPSPFPTDLASEGSRKAVSTSHSDVPPATTSQPSEESYIYIASRVGQSQRMETYRAIRQFIQTNLRPGIRVSLDGLPFISDKQRLLTLLDKMLHAGGKDGIPDFVHLPTAIADEQIATITAHTGITTPVYISTPASPAHMHRVNLERVLIEGYTTLIDQLGMYPGRKILVLFSRGLRWDAENAAYMDRFGAAATRARVTLQAIDVRGLPAVIPGFAAADSSPSVRGFPQNAARRPSFRNSLPRFETPELADKPYSADDLRFSQEGLRSLAEATGGNAIVNNNDLTAIFAKLNAQLGDYYLLGYYPRDTSRQGRFRRIDVRMLRSRIKLSFQKGYFEEKDFPAMTASERKRALERLLHSNSMPNELPLRVRFEFFRSPDGRPEAAYCAGIESRFVPAALTSKGLAVNLIMVAMAESIAADRLPFKDEQSVQLVFKPDEFRRMQADSLAMLQFPSTIRLPSGAYRWKILIRDENTGAAGAYHSTVEIPDFGATESPSSLLLTGMVATRKLSSTAEADSNVPRGIDLDEMRFYPQPASIYRRGKTVYAVYDLYNVSPALLKSPPVPRVFLLRGAVPLEKPPFGSYEVRAQVGARSLRYLAALDTKELEAGQYKLAAVLPNGKGAIVAEFTLVP